MQMRVKQIWHISVYDKKSNTEYCDIKCNIVTEVFSLFKKYPEFRGLNGLCRFLHFIPLPDEVLDFFRPVAGQIIQLLKGKAFLPTLNSGSHLKKKTTPKNQNWVVKMNNTGLKWKTLLLVALHVLLHVLYIVYVFEVLIILLKKYL